MIKDEETYRRILNKYFPDFTLEEVEELVQGYRIEKEKYETKRRQEAEEKRKLKLLKKYIYKTVP